MQVGPILAVDALFVFIAWAIGSSKGQGATGFILGLFLGPLGMILAGFLKPTVELQAKRDVALEAARERLREEGRAQARAEMQAPPAAE